jgi:hypothetical protein
MKVEISIIDEFEEDMQESMGNLDLETGWITDVQRDSDAKSKPWLEKDYLFTSGIVKLQNHEIEFTIQQESQQYLVKKNELVELKQKIMHIANQYSPASQKLKNKM